MKTILTGLFITLILLIGCDNLSDLSVNDTSRDSKTESFKVGGFEMILLPKKSPLWMDSVFTVTKQINGSSGGRITMDKYYISIDGDSIIIEADLKIPKGAFQGTKEITLTVDDEYAAIHFYPEMVFKKSLNLFQAFEGLQLENIPLPFIDFVFIKDNGSIERIKKNGLQIIIPQGIVRVQNAKIDHFSRYVWIR